MGSVYLGTFTIIVIFWVVMVFSLNVLAQDEVLTMASSLKLNTTNMAAFDDANATATGVNTVVLKPGFWRVAISIATFSLGDIGFPGVFGALLSIFNWLLIIVGAVCVYKLAWPGEG